MQPAVGGISGPLVIAGTKTSGRVVGASDRIRSAVAGINDRGQAHMKARAEIKDGPRDSFGEVRDPFQAR